jgi:cysteinyl-tRNA synthetase
VILYNSLTRRKEALPPAPGPIRMYVCGPTVYQRIHIGNARPYVVFLWLKRWLEARGYDVTLVENVTDVNDKIYEAAERQGIGSAELAERATRWYLEDTEALGIGRPDHEPLASETIPEIVGLIEELVERGLAYESEGDVYFRVASYPDYGSLSGAKLDDMVAQEPSELKEDQRDFALWKATKPGEDTSWDSPWGLGRPGWHIECSAMAEKLLGPEFEIHGGGLDLRFPHHENELAQSRGAGREFARLWAHNGMLELAEEKMSKSLGNIVSLREALDEHGREAILLLFLGVHYRSPVGYSDEAMEAARTQAEDFRTAFRVVERTGAAPSWGRFAAALDDDFNTPLALSILHAWRSAGERELVRRGLQIFGLDVVAPREHHVEVHDTLSVSDAAWVLKVVGEAPEEVRRLVDRRNAAREARDFRAADEIRDKIAALGWEVQDVPEGYRLIPKG